MEMDVSAICGNLIYTATFDGVVADEYSMPNVVYNSMDRSFAIYSEDFSILGERKITV